LFDESGLADDVNFVDVHNAGKAVSTVDHGFAFHDVVQLGRDCLLSVRIEVARGFVEQEDLGVLL